LCRALSLPRIILVLGCVELVSPHVPRAGIHSLTTGLCKKLRTSDFTTMMSHRAMCVCALVCMYQVGALTKLTVGSDLPMEKAVLSDLYLRKGTPPAKYPHPRGNEQKCSTRHKRSDGHPRHAFKNNVATNVNHINADMTARSIAYIGILLTTVILDPKP